MKLLKYIPLALIPVIPAFAQTEPRDDEEEVFELSPFVVSGEGESGYYASQTLAGTRLKTDVKDVGSSIQILTSEFLEDVGADDVNDLFLYTTSTEAAGLGGNFTSYTAGETTLGDEAFRVNPQGAQRVRGLAPADRTRNYFLTRLPGDRYFTDRVEINRGANSILFGLGSPAGIANTSLKQARFSNFGEFRQRLDSEGSLRFELDLNREIIEDRLAVRFAALADRTEFRQEPAMEDQDRYYLNLHARPWRNSAIRAFVETGERKANRPSLIFPASTMEFWFDAAAEVREQVQGLIDENGILDINGDPLVVPGDMPIAYDANLYDIYQRSVSRIAGAGDVNRDGSVDADDDIARLHALRNAVVFPQAQSDRYVEHPNASRQILKVFRWDDPMAGGSAGGTDAVQSNINVNLWNPGIATLPSYIDPNENGQYTTNYNASIQPWRDRDPTRVARSIDNLDIFDFTENLISGESAFQNDDWDHYNIAFEQLFLDDRFGIELVYDRQEYERDSFVPFQGFSGVFVDTMVNYLGRPNPNFGKPFIAGRTARAGITDERDTFRATGFFRFNPAEIWETSSVARWLGEHTFTGLYNNYDQTDDRSVFREYYTDETVTSVIRPGDKQVTDFNRVHRYMVYLSDQNLTELDSYDQVRLNRMGNQQIWNTGQGATILDLDPVTGEPFERTVGSDAFLDFYSINELEVESVAAIWNGYFLNRHLIGLVGWRRDEAYAATYDARLSSETGLPDLEVLDLVGGGDTVKKELLSWSFVAHTPDRFLPEGTELSFHYGYSENFSLGATGRDVNGDRIPFPSGQTREYGLTASLFDGKLYARMNWFETTLKDRPLQGGENLYETFINRVLLKVYSDLKESQVRGFVPPGMDPLTGQEYPGTPNFDLGMDALAQLEPLIGENVIASAFPAQPDGFGNMSDNRVNLNFGDTEDVRAEGFEFELTYNPVRNWRISLNVAKQETIITNYSPRLQALLAQTDSILGSVNGSIKDLPYFANYDDVPVQYITGPFTDNNYIGERAELLVYNENRNALAQQGKVTDEQRKWRVNLVTNYNFRDGFLKGFGIGAAYRWQDGAVIGYPTELVNGEYISDVENPHIAPGETNVDVWLRYSTGIFNGDVRWTIELRVQNINTDSDDLIPVIADTTEDYNVAVWRSGPPRIWQITSTFKF